MEEALDLSFDRLLMMMIIREVRCGGEDWIELARDRDRWRALVTAVMNLPVP